MTNQRKLFSGIVTGLMVLGAILFNSPLAAQRFHCFPSCDPRDGRMLSLVSGGLSTLSDGTLEVKISAPENQDVITVEIFDGEVTGLWDAGTSAGPTALHYTVYRDPQGDGSGSGGQKGSTIDGSTMIDNGWFPISIDARNDDAALDSSGNFHRYVLIIENMTPATITSADRIKVRTDGELRIAPEPFEVVASASGGAALIIYPDFPNIDVTRYDGTWSFLLDVPQASSFLAVWDGDFDHGSFDCSANDTDDPDTCRNLDSGCLPIPGNPLSLPTWAAISLPSEGIGSGLTPADSGGATCNTTSDPNDDDESLVFRRSPAVRYEIVTPDGTVFQNTNPSGDEEWEQFRIDQNNPAPQFADFNVSSRLPAGTYQLNVTGLDLLNLVSFRFFHDALGQPCDDCDGQVRTLKLRYLGPPANVEVRDKKGNLLFPQQSLATGEEFDFAGVGKDGKMGSRIELFVNGVLQTDIHTSCSQPIGPGLVRGDFEVVSGTSGSGFPLCPLEDGPNTPICDGDDDSSDDSSDSKSDGSSDSKSDGSSDSKSDGSSDSKSSASSDSDSSSDDSSAGGPCPDDDSSDDSSDGSSDASSDASSDGSSADDPAGCGCEGKVTRLTMQYNGGATAHVEVFQKDGTRVFNADVDPAGQFSFSGTDKKGTLGTEIEILVDGASNTKIHTSCSQPIGPGLVSGDFLVIAGSSRTGGDLCPL